jgi:hypothetical protein
VILTLEQRIRPAVAFRPARPVEPPQHACSCS